MAKGQKRSGREPKKPKSPVKKAPPPARIFDESGKSGKPATESSPSKA